jgi:hypothetical protein
MEFHFRAVDSLWFPPGKASNVFRGAFGQIFRGIACPPDCLDSKSCPRTDDCAYARMFEPRARRDSRLRLAVNAPSGFDDRPRPFVLRAQTLDGRRFEAGETFKLGVNVFDPELPALHYFRQSFQRLFEEGLGPGRSRVELVSASELPVKEIELLRHPETLPGIRVTFLTPTELKSGGDILREPRFDALFKRARDRVSGLATLYQPAIANNADEAMSAEVDYRGLGERASLVRMTAGRFEQSKIERTSSRTGQRHGLGGFTGEAEYAGDLAEFLPWLQAAHWTGVGRLTVWGNGMIRTEVCRTA